MRLYYELAKRSFQQTLTYRAAALAGTFTNGFFGIMLAEIMLAFYASRDGGQEVVAGWSSREAVTLIWINQALLMTVFTWGWSEVIRTIQDGSIANDFLKPMDYVRYWLFRDLGRAAAHFLIRGIPTFLVGVILYDLLPPENWQHAFAFLLSIAFAVIASFGLRFCLNCAGFWVMDYRGINIMSATVFNLLSGFLIPLSFFPGPVRAIANVLPYRAVIMIPNEIYAGHVSIWFGLGYQVLWIGLLFGLSYCLLGLGERKVVIQGG